MKNNNGVEPLFKFSNHWDEEEQGPCYWEDVCESLKDIFPNGIYSMSAQAFGWDRDMACCVVNGNGERLLSICIEATFAVFKYKNHWEVKIAHHDSPLGDLFVIHKHKTKDEAEEFLRGLGHRI